jgi:predicted RNase H-like HicB family nuclease
MAMMDAPRYSMVIEWVPKDPMAIVSVPERPGCHSHGSTYEEALAQGKDAIESWGHLR